MFRNLLDLEHISSAASTLLPHVFDRLSIERVNPSVTIRTSRSMRRLVALIQGKEE